MSDLGPHARRNTLQNMHQPFWKLQFLGMLTWEVICLHYTFLVKLHMQYRTKSIEILVSKVSQLAFKVLLSAYRIIALMCIIRYSEPKEETLFRDGSENLNMNCQHILINFILLNSNMSIKSVVL